MIHFTFQLIPLAIGLGVGYLLLVKAAKHEGVLEITGKFLGWLLIFASLLVGLVSGYYSVKIIKTGHLPGYHSGYYHRHEMIQPEHEQNEQGEQNESKEDDSEH